MLCSARCPAMHVMRVCKSSDDVAGVDWPAAWQRQSGGSTQHAFFAHAPHDMSCSCSDGAPGSTPLPSVLMPQESAAENSIKPAAACQRLSACQPDSAPDICHEEALPRNPHAMKTAAAAAHAVGPHHPSSSNCPSSENAAG